MARISTQYQKYGLEIEELKYQLEIYLGILESYNILGMEPPPEE